MNTVSTVILIIAIVCLLIGLLLSSSGATTGLTAMAGQDLELFKKTKDRGMVKILQMIMFILMFILLVICVLNEVLGWSN